MPRSSLLACAATAALLLPGAAGFRIRPVQRVPTHTLGTRMLAAAPGGEQQPPQQLEQYRSPSLSAASSLWRRVRAKWSEGKDGIGKLLLGVGTGALAGFGAPQTASVLQGKGAHWKGR